MLISVLKIEILMAEQGLNKTCLASRSKMSKQGLSNILKRGACEPVTAGRIARGLNVSVEEILLGGNNKQWNLK